MKRETLDALHMARRAEKAQALFYRALAASAEEAGHAQAAEDLNGLHADEQHHLSRLTVRLVELNEVIEDLAAVAVQAPDYAEWQDAAREREHTEIHRYRQLQQLDLDEPTAVLVREILESEQHHAASLGGKYMSA